MYEVEQSFTKYLWVVFCPLAERQSHRLYSRQHTIVSTLKSNAYANTCPCVRNKHTRTPNQTKWTDGSEEMKRKKSTQKSKWIETKGEREREHTSSNRTKRTTRMLVVCWKSIKKNLQIDSHIESKENVGTHSGNRTQSFAMRWREHKKK